LKKNLKSKEPAGWLAGCLRVFEKHQSERTMSFGYFKTLKELPVFMTKVKVLSQYFDTLNFVGFKLEVVRTTQKFVCLFSSQGLLFYSLTFTNYMHT
jgi:hypothetical protein